MHYSLSIVDQVAWGEGMCYHKNLHEVTTEGLHSRSSWGEDILCYHESLHEVTTEGLHSRSSWGEDILCYHESLHEVTTEGLHRDPS